MDWQAEIREFHEYFERLFLGTETSLERAEVVLAPTFSMAAPDGAIHDRTAIIAMLRDGIGHTSSLSIETTDYQLISATDELIVARYIETHHLRDRRQPSSLDCSVHACAGHTAWRAMAHRARNLDRRRPVIGPQSLPFSTGPAIMCGKP